MFLIFVFLLVIQYVDSHAMQNEVLIFAFALLLVIVLLDIITYRAIHRIIRDHSTVRKNIVNIIFWGISAGTFFFLFWITYHRKNYEYTRFYYLAMHFFGIFILFYLPKLFLLIFIILQDLVYLGGSLTKKVFPEKMKGNKALTISRRNFITKTGLVLSALPFFSVLHGIIWGRYNFRVRKVRLGFPGLPESFSGLTFIQISDLHLGSFGRDTSQLEEAVEIINMQKPDYVFFTGDMVNSLSAEMESFVPLLSRIQSAEGKYSVLGNHDYGDDYDWPTEDEYRENLEKLVVLQNRAGFRVLRNESVELRKSGQVIDLLGVENWGLPPFPQYGDLEKAMMGLPADRFKILLSHDPSHWDARVAGKTAIDLTLSGHTHGMQFAVGVGKHRWSPVKFKYPRWSGLYQEGSQALYVNIGLGFIGFPGRVGTPPEITVFELQKEPVSSG